MIEINKYLNHKGKRFIVRPGIVPEHCNGCYFCDETGTGEHCPDEDCEDVRRSDNINIIYVLDPFKYGK